MEPKLTEIAGLVACDVCYRRARLQRSPYDPPYLFENIDDLSNPQQAAVQFEVRGKPNIYQRRPYDAYARAQPDIERWEPIDRKYLLCITCARTSLGSKE